MVRQDDQEGARLLSNVIRPGNRRIHALNHLALADHAVVVDHDPELDLSATR